MRRRRRCLPLESSFAHESTDPRCESTTSEIGSCIENVTERILRYSAQRVEIALPRNKLLRIRSTTWSFLPLADASVEHLLNYRAQ